MASLGTLNWGFTFRFLKIVSVHASCKRLSKSRSVYKKISSTKIAPVEDELCGRYEATKEARLMTSHAMHLPTLHGSDSYRLIAGANESVMFLDSSELQIGCRPRYADRTSIVY